MDVIIRWDACRPAFAVKRAEWKLAYKQTHLCKFEENFGERHQHLYLQRGRMGWENLSEKLIQLGCELSENQQKNANTFIKN